MNHEGKHRWTAVCPVDEILPGTGVCAMVDNRHIAIFRTGDGQEGVYAIDNYDPNAQASVLSRGLVCSLGERLVVASPIYKHHFDLESGACLEAPEHSVRSWPVRLDKRMVWIGH
jgi:nitrite reductase (NADH) small subunit